MVFYLLHYLISLKIFFEKEEFIDEISHITTYNMNVNERLVLYKYLIENIGIDKTRYHDIYESYVENLSIYFTNTQKNKTSEILTEILTYLGVDPEIAEDDACKIEHDLSDVTFAQIKKYYLDKIKNH